MRQTVGHKKVKPWQGILLILGILAVMILLNYLITLVGMRIGSTAAAIFFWIIGILIVLWMYRTYVLVFQYMLDTDVLYISRRYGKRLRSVTDVYLSRVRFVGTPEAAKKRFPVTKRIRAVHSRCSIEVTAVVYGTSDGLTTLLLQADEALRAELVARAKKNN